MGLALIALSGEKFYILACAKCGMSFGIPQDYEDRRRGDHKEFYCPSGHSNYYPGKSEAEKLRDQLAVEQQRTATERTRREWAELNEKTTYRRLSATKGKVTLLKRRIGKGACPCCKQRFADLREHMEAQHPGYGETA